MATAQFDYFLSLPLSLSVSLSTQHVCMYMIVQSVYQLPIMSNISSFLLLLGYVVMLYLISMIWLILLLG